ncbi:uncharacterized protein MONBRDRAFT_11035 [Monosiga brevicollis MX1]|uniref:SAP domain-containing protein n=1 Tax=Monosiga brevicollis TaxID=81824 RepID=A9V810_MONBE|nr:uncharacterized protein MONBRDRAFT_11035 [Monosiga brevicollis MX1]EDQ86469.1 predicted protein [Monosiga brevicollis MX1]|eukprot:XP_001748859.1 hypothetical protein [Monosiga brevicollis MX1]
MSLPLYGVSRCEFEAARGRRRRGDVIHDGRQLCTKAERVILANWLSTMSDLRSSRTRSQSTLAICEILQVRERALQDQTRLQPVIADSIAPLSAPERKLLRQKEAYDLSPAEAVRPTISKQWFRALEKEFDLKLTKAKAQTEARALALTQTTCEAYFTCLEDALSRLDFVHQSGRHVGCIKASCLSRIWGVDEMPGLRTGLGTTQVYTSMARREDAGVVRGRTHNEPVTAVLAICMDGDMAPPMMIHARRALSPRAIGPAQLPSTVASDASFDHFMICSTHSGYINRRLFVAFCRRLRAYIGDQEPLLLLSDGHTTRIDADVVAYLRTINIFLLVIPPNTSHALAPSDQWHCYIHQKRRDLCLHTTGVVYGHAPTLDEEIQALYRAINVQREYPSRIQSAFRHAGLSKTSRGTEHMSNQPRLSRAHSPNPRRRVTTEGSTTPSHIRHASREIDEDMPRTPTPPSSDSTPFSSSMSTPRKIAKARSLSKKKPLRFFLSKACERLQGVVSQLQHALDSSRVALTNLQVDLSPRLQIPTPRRGSRRSQVWGGLSWGDSALRLEQQQQARRHQVRRNQRHASEADLCGALGVHRITISALKAACRDRRLSSTGSRADLISRVRGSLGLQSPDTAFSHAEQVQGFTEQDPVRDTAASSASIPPTMASTPLTSSDTGVSQETEDPVLADTNTASTMHLSVNPDECGSNEYHLAHNAPADFAFWLRPIPANTLLSSREEQDHNPSTLAAMEMVQPDPLEMQQIIERLDDGCRRHRDHMAALKRPHT